MPHISTRKMLYARRMPSVYYMQMWCDAGRCPFHGASTNKPDVFRQSCGIKLIRALALDRYAVN